MLPVAAERFPNDRIVRLLEALGLFVESGEIPLHNGAHALQGRFFTDSTAEETERKKNVRNIP